MKILIAGDCHGRMSSLAYLQDEVIKQFPECNTCIQVGDFGFYPQIMDRLKFKMPMKTYAIDGNHEEHDWLRLVQRKGHWERWATNNDIHFVDRRVVMNIGGVNIGFLGGAMNVDRPNRGSTFLRYNNYVSEEDVVASLENFNKYELDLIVTHSCPTGIGVNIPGEARFLPWIKEFITDPFGIPAPPLDDCGDQALTNLWNGLKHKPKTWLFGHFHKLHQNTVGNTEFVCVGSSDFTTNENFIVPFIYDTETQIVSIGERVKTYGQF